MLKAPGVQAPPSFLDTAAKAVIALHRAIPITRMLDYGMNVEDSAAMGAIGADGVVWDEAAEVLGKTRMAAADELAASGELHRASVQLEWGAAALSVGQLAFNHDNDRKRSLLSLANTLCNRAAKMADALHRRIVISGKAGERLFGWSFPVTSPRGCVLILGGLSGWGAAYFGLARAFNARGLAAVIAEGPGQGETRMASGLFLSRDALLHFAPFVALARDLGEGQIGIMGNSFGGLIAAHVAAADQRILACCINGALPAFTVPEFRTAREQMESVFGATDAPLGRLVEAFSFDPRATPLSQAVLLVEGGADPLVPLGAQAAFVAGREDLPTVLQWADGEHTIYNHAADRNALVSAWFADTLNKAEGK